MKPHDYQRSGILEIIDKFKEKNKLLYQLDTGGGKTVVFSFLSKYWSEKRGQKVLITCHREELVDQTCETLAKMDLSFSKITASNTKINKNAEVFVAMVETINNRLETGKIDLPDVGLVISDEAHVLVFEKIYKYFENSKILGVSATPVVLKKVNFCKCSHCKKEYDEITECCGEEVEEWTKPFTMSMIYEDIVVGPKIDFLIEFGQLVPEISFIEKYSNDKLKEDSDGEFTTKSQDEAFGSADAVFNIVRNYEQFCKGKRTIIFNSSSKNNKLVYDALKESGANVKLFDSRNKEEKISRRQLIKWFRETPDAVLCNVNIFTAGFDCKEVEAVILNRATNSLALFLQMAGRGGRSSQLIYKPHFVLVDGGGNIERFGGEWSDPSRDWKKLFFEGLGKPKARKIDSESIQSCDNCGSLYPKKEFKCSICNFEPEPQEPVQIKTKFSETILSPIKQIPAPDGEKIYQYTKKIGENIHFSHKIMISQIVDMFRYYGVTKDLYENVKKSKELEIKVTKMIRKCYFVLLSKSDIQTGQNRTLAYLIEKAKQKIEIFYYGKRND